MKDTYGNDAAMYFYPFVLIVEIALRSNDTAPWLFFQFDMKMFFNPIA
jgi:hypothetical protein